MVTATFRFHEELNDFLAPERRGRVFSAPCASAASVKHMIEALGVPHTEVELILVNDQSVGFAHPLDEGDEVEVYPRCKTPDAKPLPLVRAHRRQHPRFVADAHLGGLAHLLRMTGFDTLYDNNFQDREIEALAARDERIVLTRDRELLKRRTIIHGCYVRSLKSEAQLRELFERLELAKSARPFTLCLHCNVPLHRVDKQQVVDRLPPRVRAHYERFSMCGNCARVFWEGTHWRNMRRIVDDLIEGGARAP